MFRGSSENDSGSGSDPFDGGLWSVRTGRDTRIAFRSKVRTRWDCRVALEGMHLY